MASFISLFFTNVNGDFYLMYMFLNSAVSVLESARFVIDTEIFAVHVGLFFGGCFFKDFFWFFFDMPKCGKISIRGKELMCWWSKWERNIRALYC